MKRSFSTALSLFLIAAIIFGTPLQIFAQEQQNAIYLNTKMISGIGISGNYPYIENKIRRYLTIRPGDPYNDKIMDEQIERILNFYKREGWFNTRVGFSPEYIEDYDGVQINFKIKRGFLLRYRNINVTGNYSLPTSLVSSKLNPWRPYTPRRLREGITKIEEVYRKEGYPLCRIQLAEKNVDLQKHRVDVTVNIDEGPFVSTEFTGNEHLGGLQLLNVITIYTEGAIDSYELEESSNAIKERYRQRGFPNATVSYSRKELSNNHINIVFAIDEGKPERIRNIFVEGNEAASSSAVRGSMASKSLSLIHQGIYDEDVLSEDIDNISNFYRQQGFLDEETNQPYIEKVENGTQLNILVPIVEGPQTKLSAVNFHGDIHFPKKDLTKQLKSKVDEPLNATILESERDSIIRYYSDNGYPYVQAHLKIVRTSETEASLDFDINSGPFVKFGEITITGDFITSQKAIRKAITIKEGDPFSFENLAKSKISLRRLGAFASASVDPSGLADKETVIPVNIRVEELRPFKLDFDIGYSTDDSVVASIDFANRNSFGWAKRTIFKLTGGKKLSRGEIGWVDPKLAGTDLELSSSGWLQYEDKSVFTYIQAGIGAGLYRRYHRTSFLVRTALERNYFITGSSTAADAESLRNNSIVSNSMSVSYDTRNSFAYPLKGIFARGYVNFFDEISGNNAHFVKFGLTNGLYYTLVDRFTLANEVRFDNIQTWENNVSIPSNELLLLGGDNSLRGFDRNSLGPVNAIGRPTGGRLRLINSTELRIGLFNNFKGIVFHDMGFLTNSYHSVTAGQLRHSIGFGLDYITPIGPISAAYGFIIDRKPGEHVGRFHLQFGYTF